MSFFYDLFRLLKTLNLKKVHNLLKLRFSYFASIITQNNHHKGYPAFISIEPTTSCNLKCPQCFTTHISYTRPKGNISSETFETIIHQTSYHAFYLNLYFQGEPFLHKNLTELIKHAKNQGFYVVVSTNAHFLDTETIKKITGAGLDRIIVSLDGSDEETYLQYRKNGDFNQVIEGIKRLSDFKKKNGLSHPFIELQFLIHRKNQSQTEDIKKLGKKLGVQKISIKTFQIIDTENAIEWIPEKKSRYTLDGNRGIRLKKKLKNSCWRMWSSCVFTWDGKLIPCCFDKNASYAFGNIQHENVLEIWESPKYNAFRQKILNTRSEIDICNNCSE